MKLEATQINSEIERGALKNLLEAAKEFYKDPKNKQAYEAWKKSKEVNTCKSH